eukprot:gnl/Dysnectes_brevis/9148_a16795_200.p1 GENE.gnl/Dysnectes_brevis/9148_a16795_200~~gnl/Dysnectes_brevis/9148_a16795_200.p1  ORF type:complete len:199 (-),score=13.13 gnl/Dysnectes_brevis/9148_a16795_200:66-632(-)
MQKQKQLVQHTIDQFVSLIQNFQIKSLSSTVDSEARVDLCTDLLEKFEPCSRFISEQAELRESARRSLIPIIPEPPTDVPDSQQGGRPTQAQLTVLHQFIASLQTVQLPLPPAGPEPVHNYNYEGIGRAATRAADELKHLPRRLGAPTLTNSGGGDGISAEELRSQLGPVWEVAQVVRRQVTIDFYGQ